MIDDTQAAWDSEEEKAEILPSRGSQPPDPRGLTACQHDHAARFPFIHEDGGHTQGNALGYR